MKIATSAFSSLILLCLVAPALARDAAIPLATAYSDISRKLCRGDHKPNARIDEHEMVSYRCKGVAGLWIDVVYNGTSLRASLRRDGDAGASPHVGASYDIGDKIEWRGHPGVKGFEPEAAILRLKSYDYDGDGKLGSVLVILRASGKMVCPAAFLDAAGTAQPNEVARRIADEAAASFQCGIDSPRIVGPETTLVKETLARSG